jgi:hypothetical protein
MRAAVMIAVLGTAMLQAGAAFAGPLATSVPEPMSLGIAAVGVGAVAWIKFRRRR